MANEKFNSEYFLSKRTINIFGTIDDAMAESVIAQLQFLDEQDPAKDIIIQINSPGGNVSSGLAIYDTMNFVRPRIITVAIGMAASMGAFLLSSGSKGYRRATASSEVLIHQPLGGAQGQASDILIAAEHIKRTRDKLNDILAANTGKAKEIIERDTDRDYIMTAKEALEYGIIDYIIPSKSKATE